MILVDSSVWIDYFRGVRNRPTDMLDFLLEREPLAIGDLILTEVLQGFADDRVFREVKRMMSTLTLVELGGRSVAIRAAENYRTLRRLGITVRRTADCIIATKCIESRLTLLHNDRDFDPFEEHLGLRVAGSGGW